MNKLERKNLYKKIDHIDYLITSYAKNHIQAVASLQSKLCNIIKKDGFTKKAKNIFNCQQSIRKKENDFWAKWKDLNHQVSASWRLE